MPSEDCQPGPIHPKQVLEADFSFDSHEHLQSFDAHGTAIGNREAAQAVLAQVEAHPEMSESEVTAAFKKAGAKYGPGDKGALIRDFPYAKLERFLGKLKIVFVSYPYATNRDIGNESPLWEVTAQASENDGTIITYNLGFEQFKGDLVMCAVDGNR
jgi:hypothetical protein